MDRLRRIEFALIFLLFILNSLFIFSYRNEINANVIFEENKENISPSNFLSEDDIRIYDDRIIIYLENASIARYSFSNSMMPFLDENTNGIVVRPTSENQINLGDIVSFERDNELIVHRVISKGEDEDGIYFITKGDNNNEVDGKVRFSEIESVLIMVLY